MPLIRGSALKRAFFLLIVLSPGVGSQRLHRLHGIGRSRLLLKCRPGSIDPCSVKLTRNGRRSLLIERVVAGSAQERVGDFSAM